MNKKREKVFNSNLGAKILEDQDLAQWFFEVCIGKRPQVKISQKILGEMEKSEFIKRTNIGFELGTAGETFARVLGLIPERKSLDLIPELLDYLSGGVSKRDEKKKTQDSNDLKEKKDESRP